MNKLLKYLVVLALFSSIASNAAQVVKVGVYHFPPYVFADKEATGITVQMIALMNKFQKDYEFQAVLTTPKRRYIDFEKQKFDMLLFENKSWGWQKYPLAVSQAFLKGGEHYVSLAKPGRGQDYFTDFKSKAMIGILGYHYAFAGFNADLPYLNKHFRIALTDGQQKSLDLLLSQRGDMTVLSKAYLNYYYGLHPENKAKLLVSDKLDQVYRHTVLLRKNHPKITIKDINRMLFAMKKAKTLTPLWQKHGLAH